MTRTISVAIPHYNNARFMNETISSIINDTRISEIIICDDKSNDLQELTAYINSCNSNKIKLYLNETNLGCYHNKLESISKCTNEWAILLDSDNIIDKSYIDILYSINNWDKTYIYAPHIAATFPGPLSPNLNYTKYANTKITKEIYINDFNDNNFQCLINTCNYFLPVNEYKSCMVWGKNTYSREQIDSLDSAVLFTDWLSNNNNIFIVSNLVYKHRIHSLSNYAVSNARKYENMVKQFLYNKIKQLI